MKARARIVTVKMKREVKFKTSRIRNAKIYKRKDVAGRERGGIETHKT